MFFLGYHGTTLEYAKNIMETGVRREALPKQGQIGPGFYIAKLNGTLPQWGAGWAAMPGRLRDAGWKYYFWRRIVEYTGGYDNGYFSDDDQQIRIPKVYSTQPLKHVKWNIMNEPDIKSWDIPGDAIQPDSEQRKQYIQEQMEHYSKWLQMVVPFCEIEYLRAKLDDGKFEATTNWHSKEDPQGDRKPHVITGRYSKESPF